MITAFLAPHDILNSMFGLNITHPVAEIVVRSWGFVIFLIGTTMYYAAFNPEFRPFVTTLACLSKAVFISLFLVYGQEYLDKLFFTIVFDTLFILAFGLYLVNFVKTKKV